VAIVQGGLLQRHPWCWSSPTAQDLQARRLIAARAGRVPRQVCLIEVDCIAYVDAEGHAYTAILDRDGETCRVVRITAGWPVEV
jgi:hypothetical protein